MQHRRISVPPERRLWYRSTASGRKALDKHLRVLREMISETEA